MPVARWSAGSWGLACVSRPGRQIIASLAGLSALAVPRVADACSYATVVIESSYPERGASDVPTNAMLFVSGPLDGPGVSLERADGTPVAIEVLELTPRAFDVRPLEELEPNQAYVLRAPGPTEPGPNPLLSGTNKVLEFTTGAGPAAVPAELLAPELGNVVQLFPAVPAACDGYQLCTDAEVPAGTTLEVHVEQEVLQVAARGPWLRTYGGGIGDGCVTVSVRAFTGHRSLPTSVCKDAIADYPATEPALTCENYDEPLVASAAEPVEVIPAEAAGGGCLLGPAPRPDPTRAWSLSSVLAVWLHLRARRARRAN